MVVQSHINGVQWGERYVHEESETKGEGNEVEFDWNSTSLEHILAISTISNQSLSSYREDKKKDLQPWDVGEEESNTESDDGCTKDVDILQGRVLERTTSAASSCEQVTGEDDMKKKKRYGRFRNNVPPLHQNQGEEIYTLSLEKDIVWQLRP